MISYIENSKKFKISEFINEFRKSAEYKINIQKSNIFLYISNE